MRGLRVKLNIDVHVECANGKSFMRGLRVKLNIDVHVECANGKSFMIRFGSHFLTIKVI